MFSEVWNFRMAHIDLEDLDGTAELYHWTTLATVTLDFRVRPSRSPVRQAI